MDKLKGWGGDLKNWAGANPGKAWAAGLGSMAALGAGGYLLGHSSHDQDEDEKRKRQRAYKYSSDRRGLPPVLHSLSGRLGGAAPLGGVIHRRPSPLHPIKGRDGRIPPARGVLGVERVKQRAELRERVFCHGLFAGAARVTALAPRLGERGQKLAAIGHLPRERAQVAA